MKKIVVNKCYGGFGLSYEGVQRYAEIKGILLFAYYQDNYGDGPYLKWTGKGKPPFLVHYTTKEIKTKDDINESYWSCRDLARDDSALVQVVEQLGNKANSGHSNLEITEIPKDADWQIDEYDGQEWVAEKHRTWF